MSDFPTSQGPVRKRPLRVAAELHRELTDLIPRIVGLPSGIMVSITDVEVSEDLAHARVYFSVLGPQEKETGAMAARLLNLKKGALRHEIAQRLVLRQHPDLRFIYDETPARAARIELLLSQVRHKGENPSGESV